MLVATFVRHGETKYNVARIVQSQTHGELTERGQKMADHLGHHLKDEKFAIIYSSDLERCHHTTRNILKHSNHEQPKPILHEVLRERHFGDLEYKPGEVVLEIMEKTGLPEHIMPIPGGESYEDMLKRVGTFFNMLCDYADYNANESKSTPHALVVTHGLWIRSLMEYFRVNGEDFDVDGFHEELPFKTPENTGTLRVVIHKTENEDSSNSKNGESKKRKVQIVHFNNCDHLPEGI